MVGGPKLAIVRKMMVISCVNLMRIVDVLDLKIIEENARPLKSKKFKSLGNFGNICDSLVKTHLVK